MGKSPENDYLGREIGERIGKLRYKHNETQQELADSINVSRNVIENWEKGSRYVKSKDLVALAKHFNVSTDYLLGTSLTETPEYHSFAEKTGFSNPAVQKLYFLSGNARNDLTIKRNRKAFELLFTSPYFDDLLDSLVKYLDTESENSSSSLDVKKYLSLDETVSTATKGAFHVISSRLFSEVLRVKAGTTIQNAFDAIAKSAKAEWSDYLPQKNTAPGDNNTESGK